MSRLIKTMVKEGLLEGVNQLQNVKYDAVLHEIEKMPDSPESKKLKGALGAYFKGAKRVMPAVGVALDAHEIATSEGEERERAIGSAVGGAAGAAVFGAAGSVVPVVGTSVGVAVGSVVGSAVGSAVGEWVAPAVGDLLEDLF